MPASIHADPRVPTPRNTSELECVRVGVCVWVGREGVTVSFVLVCLVCAVGFVWWFICGDISSNSFWGLGKLTEFRVTSQ